MAFGFTKPRCSPIGVDFGADSLKLLQVAPTDPPQLLAAAYAEIPEEARFEPAARHEFVSSKLRDLLRTQPFKGKTAVCSIPAFQTLMQPFQVVSTDPAEFAEEVQTQLRQRMNVEPSRMVLRYFAVGPVAREGAAKQEVICLAASRETIMRHVETLQKARLDVVGMHDEPSAILKSFCHLHRKPEDEQRTTCFVDIGAATTKVVIAHGSVLVFAKALHAAGDDRTRQYAKAAKCSFGQARRNRMAQAGLEADGGVALAPQPDVAIEGETLECLIDELRLCVRYHGSLFPGRPIEKLVFVGGESRHLTLCQSIAKALRIGAQLGDPLSRLVQINAPRPSAITPDFTQPQPGWAVPLGLCLFGDSPK